jgi:leucine-zipper of insertion element IS481/Integrase core domain
VSHRNARLTVYGRRLLVERVLAGRPVAHVAAGMGVSRATGYKWPARYQSEGVAGLVDRSGQSHTSPTRTPDLVEEQVVMLRTERKPGPARIGPIPGPAPSTVHRVLTRHRLHRSAFPDRPTGTVIRRYERDRPGELIHADVRKLGRIPDSGGHRARGRAETRAAAFYAENGIDRTERDLTDNARAHRKTAARHQALTQPGTTGKLTRAHRPRTNGKAERFNRTPADEWAHIRPHTTNHDRTEALATFLHTYNYHRSHTALEGQPPISRVNNAPTHYTRMSLQPGGHGRRVPVGEHIDRPVCATGAGASADRMG